MRCDKFSGVGVALVTPFKADSTIDYDALAKHIEFLIEGGVNFITMTGTTGEPPTLTKEEKNSLVQFIVNQVNGRIPLMIGIGGNNTKNVVEEIKSTNFAGIDAILSISPYYNKPNQQGIYQHFKEIANASPLPVVLYNVPGRTGMNMTWQTICKLAEDFKNVVAVKEASGNFAQIMQIIKNKPQEFSLISGDDSLTVPMMSVGACGVISVAANVVPKQFSEMLNLCKSGDYTNASKIHYQLLDLMNALFEEGSPAGAKAALNILGIMDENLRLPLVPVSSQLKDKIKTLLKNI